MIMFNCVPVRKILKIVSTKRSLKRKERMPIKFSKVIDENTNKTKSHNRLIWIILLLLVTYCVHLLYIRCHMKKYGSLRFRSSEEAFAFLRRLQNSSNLTLPVCCMNVWNETYFGKIIINKTIKYQAEVEYKRVQIGGYYRPEHCKSSHKIAVLIPYRNRENSLSIFLYNIHPILMKQKIEYHIFVIEQQGEDDFNRGKLFNVGFEEIKKFGKWRCVVFHDVDLLPLHDRILYSCPTWPRHMCVTVVENKDPNFRTIFGGVSSMNIQHFQRVNGYSNLYWGWGGEDNDLFWRIRASGLPILTYTKDIARYTALQHFKQQPNPYRFSLLNSATKRYKNEGLSTLKYKVESVSLHHLYTHIIVDINPDGENTTENILNWIMKKRI